MDKRQMEDEIVARIKTVYDPEIPVDVYELGLIYDIEISDDNDVVITMTLTTPSCPVAESLPQEVEDTVKEIEQVKNVSINLTFDPPWGQDMMSEEAMLELGFL